MIMLLDDGVVYICRLFNVAPNGKKPKFVLSRIKKYWFAERTVGFSRFYEAKGVNEQVDMLVRIPYDRGVRIGMYAVLGNGEQFHIDNVQPLIDDSNGLRCVDLTLSRIEEYYDVAE